MATELRHGRPVPPRRYPSVTLLFSGIVGFSQLCADPAHRDPMSIVQMLNQLYTAFDTLTDPRKNPNVYKVGSAAEQRAEGALKPCESCIRATCTSSCIFMDNFVHGYRLYGDPT